MRRSLVHLVSAMMIAVASVGCADRPDRQASDPPADAGEGGTRAEDSLGIVPSPRVEGAGSAGRAGNSLYRGGNDIIPGEGIGGVRIGDRFEEVVKKLGQPDSADAAMGHVWGWWLSGGDDSLRRELGIYATFDDAATSHYVRQIRVTSPYFVTADGISTRSALGSILRRYPGARSVARFRGSFGDTVDVYDATAAGIAFEAVRKGNDTAAGTCLAIIVHHPGEEIADRYRSVDSSRPPTAGGYGKPNRK